MKTITDSKAEFKELLRRFIQDSTRIYNDCPVGNTDAIIWLTKISHMKREAKETLKDLNA